MKLYKITLNYKIKFDHETEFKNFKKTVFATGNTSNEALLKLQNKQMIQPANAVIDDMVLSDIVDVSFNPLSNSYQSFLG